MTLRPVLACMLLTALCACQRAAAPVAPPVVVQPVPPPPPPRVIPPEPAVDTRHVTTVDLRRRQAFAR